MAERTPSNSENDLKSKLSQLEQTGTSVYDAEDGSTWVNINVNEWYRVAPGSKPEYRADLIEQLKHIKGEPHYKLVVDEEEVNVSWYDTQAKATAWVFPPQYGRLFFPHTINRYFGEEMVPIHPQDDSLFVRYGRFEQQTQLSSSPSLAKRDACTRLDCDNNIDCTRQISYCINCVSGRLEDFCEVRGLPNYVGINCGLHGSCLRDTGSPEPKEEHFKTKREFLHALDKHHWTRAADQL
ncbi:hypothetical protein IE53DRAFT_366299 [Violaceomyces palustris]|uniref:Uncharacterized protein n=1 Tax=Violaceomyces palustris TaxID=1673888 RepID=A0ACD0P5R4_9BASI|nr:hypothetical protein IE53DRAFT_366299 [Violaceomyces palustris]